MMYPWGSNKRFNSYPDYFIREFGGRLQKISVDAGFSCPNRDSITRDGGCTFCNNDAFNPSYCRTSKSITGQISLGIKFHQRRYGRAIGFLVYFQAYSNTYAPLEKLISLYNEALSHPGVEGIVVGTRPDCIDQEKLDYFQELSEKKYLVIEYGIESCYNKTLDRINRGHTFETTKNALEATSARGIKTGGHVIIGLPGETRAEILQQADILSSLPLHSLKFHQLQIVKNTQMEKEFHTKPDDFEFFSFEEYISFMVTFIEKLNPGIIVERVAGEAAPTILASGFKPWGKRNHEILRVFEQTLELRNTWQGKYYQK